MLLRRNGAEKKTNKQTCRTNDVLRLAVICCIVARRLRRRRRLRRQLRRAATVRPLRDCIRDCGQRVIDVQRCVPRSLREPPTANERGRAQPSVVRPRCDGGDHVKRTPRTHQQLTAAAAAATQRVHGRAARSRDRGAIYTNANFRRAPSSAVHPFFALKTAGRVPSRYDRLNEPKS